MRYKEVYRLIKKPYKVLVEVRYWREGTVTVSISSKWSKIISRTRTLLSEEGIDTDHVYVDGYGYVRLVYTRVGADKVALILSKAEEALSWAKRKRRRGLAPLELEI